MFKSLLTDLDARTKIGLLNSLNNDKDNIPIDDIKEQIFDILGGLMKDPDWMVRVEVPKQFAFICKRMVENILVNTRERSSKGRQGRSQVF